MTTLQANQREGAIKPELDGIRLEVAYTYDGTMEGLFTAVFKAYENHEDPTDVCPKDRFQPRLGQFVQPIDTQIHLAERVAKGIINKCGEQTYNYIKRACLVDDPQAGSHIYRFIRYAMKTGSQARHHLTSPLVAPLEAYNSFVLNEAENMRQFVRFRELENGLFFASIHPKANVIPLCMDGFAARFNTQPFVIYDETHRLAGVYEGPEGLPDRTRLWGNPHWYLISVDAQADLNIPAEAPEESVMQKAWKSFYRATTIAARYHPELQQHFMPKRFWKDLVELQEDYEPRAASLATSSRQGARPLAGQIQE